nr:putative TerB family tellurite resistance protein [uncultured bacterium]
MLEKLKQLFAVPDSAQPIAAQHLAELAATALLIETSHADHDVDAQETRTILDIAQKTFALTDDEVGEFFARAELKKSAATSLFEFTDLINQYFDKAQKFALIEACWQVAYADGKLDRYEDHTVRKIAELIYVSHSDFIRAKHRAAKQDHRAAKQANSTTPTKPSVANSAAKPARE